MCLILGIVAVSCKKEAGPTGQSGTNGTNGNANVRMYSYSQTTLNAGNSYYAYFSPIGLTSGMIDSSLLVTYYRSGLDDWNVANGLGPQGRYNTIQFTIPGPPAIVGIYLRNADGTSYTGIDVVWDSIRIFVVPANVFKIAKHDKVDFQNYKQVKDYYNAK